MFLPTKRLVYAIHLSAFWLCVADIGLTAYALQSGLVTEMNPLGFNWLGILKFIPLFSFPIIKDQFNEASKRGIVWNIQGCYIVSVALLMFYIVVTTNNLLTLAYLWSMGLL